MASIWRRAMVYLGLVDDDEYEHHYESYEEPAPAAPTRRTAAPAPAPMPEPEPSGVRTLPRESELGTVTVQPRPAVVRPIAMQSAKVYVLAPGGFNDAQEIGDKLKANQPVIVNLQGTDRDLGRRLIDFACGLAYG